MTHPHLPKTMVGFVIPAWNASPWIPELLDSLLEQNSRDWRAAIVDDGSTDDTREVADRWRHRALLRGKIRHDQLWITRREHGGLVKAVNYALSWLAPWVDVIGCLGADDHVSDNYVSVLAAPFVNPAVVCSYPRVQEFGSRVAEWNPGPYCPGYLAEKNIIPGCALWRRAAWLQLKGFDERFTAGMEDWHFAARAEAAGIIGPYNRPVFGIQAMYYHRARPDSLTDRMLPEYRGWAERTVAELFPAPPIKQFVHRPREGHAAIVRGPLDLAEESSP